MIRDTRTLLRHFNSESTPDVARVASAIARTIRHPGEHLAGLRTLEARGHAIAYHSPGCVLVDGYLRPVASLVERRRTSQDVARAIKAEFHGSRR